MNQPKTKSKCLTKYICRLANNYILKQPDDHIKLDYMVTQNRKDKANKSQSKVTFLLINP